MPHDVVNGYERFFGKDAGHRVRPKAIAQQQFFEVAPDKAFPRTRENINLMWTLAIMAMS
jgi:hypothetical protein